MSKLSVGQKVTVNIPNKELAELKSIHVLDEKQDVVGQILYVHEDGSVNVICYDHVGTAVALNNIPSSKPKEENQIYVSASK